MTSPHRRPTSCPCGCGDGSPCITETTPLRRYLERLAAARSWDERYVARMRRRWRDAA